MSTAEVPAGHDVETAFVRGDEDALRLATTSSAAWCTAGAPFLDPERAKDVTQEVS